MFAIINARWIWLYRRAQPWDIDESGYLSIALANSHALVHGVWAWIQSVEAPSIQAPLTTSLASLVFFVSGPHPVASLAVPIAAGIVTIVAAGLLGRDLDSDGTGLASAALVASCPTIINYARTFFFALPATAVLTVALLALVRSRGFRTIPWSIVFGVAMGLLPLARTMTIAFIPGLLIAAGLAAAAPGDRAGRRIARLLLAVVLAVLTAASWLAFNGTLVFNYLFSFGYGARAGEFGPGETMSLLDAWIYTFRLVINSIHGPHALVVALAVVLSPAILVMTGWRSGPRGTAMAGLQSPLLPIFLVVAEALTALTSSHNKGSAFEAPIIPALIVLSVAVIARVLRIGTARWSRPLGITLCTAVCLAASIPLAGLSRETARPWTLDARGLGPILVSDGRGTIQLYEASAGFHDSDVRPLSTEEGKAWTALANTVAAAVGLEATAFGFRHYILNVNSVRLQIAARGFDGARLTQVEPFVTGETRDGYVTWLTAGEAAAACQLVTLEGSENQFLPAVTSAKMADAARQAGFAPEQALMTPDERTVTLWRRTSTSAGPCARPSSVP